MSVESLRRCRDKKIHIVSAFQRLLPDSAIESLYAYGISEIAQAFWMAQELERVYQNEQARPGLGRTSILPLHLEGSEEMEGYTDGSLVDIPLSQFTGFGVLFSFGEEQFRGCYREAPFSSIMAEVMIMAIFMALVLAEAGPQKTLEIEADSRAAIGALKALQRRDPKRP
ncbi:hypothetical protein IW138_006538 [Coemansia sp. RSA 986]|nr:hypothetical protein IW138_006538 [Coemansia sp. RSA 986]